MGRAAGLTDREISDIARYETSDAYSDLDRLVLELATAMSRTPAEVPDELRTALLEHLGSAAFVEVVASIAWENHRARLNRALGVRPTGFSDGAVCALPAHDPNRIQRPGGAHGCNAGAATG